LQYLAIVQSMKSTAIYPRARQHYNDGSFIEIVVWHLDAPVPPSLHRYKYRLVYIVNGVRVVGYDNERGKGDHKHFNDAEIPYLFSTPERLLADFQKDVKQWREQNL